MTPTQESLDRARKWMNKQDHIPAFDEIPDDDPTLRSLALEFDRVGIKKQIEALSGPRLSIKALRQQLAALTQPAGEKEG